jgi:hypothetical protein
MITSQMQIIIFFPVKIALLIVMWNAIVVASPKQNNFNVLD